LGNLIDLLREEKGEVKERRLRGDWKIGGLEDKDLGEREEKGRRIGEILEDWKIGRLEDWKIGRLEDKDLGERRRGKRREEG
jgi:hypothetical protein